MGSTFNRKILIDKSVNFSESSMIKTILEVKIKFSGDYQKLGSIFDSKPRKLKPFLKKLTWDTEGGTLQYSVKA